MPGPDQDRSKCSTNAWADGRGRRGDRDGHADGRLERLRLQEMMSCLGEDRDKRETTVKTIYNKVCVCVCVYVCFPQKCRATTEAGCSPRAGLRSEHFGYSSVT